MLLLYSTGGIFSKYAAGQEFFGAGFWLFYGLLIMVLGLYAIGWQQILRWIPLSVAFAHKSVCVIWSLVWGIKKNIGIVARGELFDLHGY